MRLFLMILALSLMTPSSSHACTSFQFKSDTGHTIMAKNYDWWVFHDHGLVMTNARNVKKTGLVLKHGGTPASWTSQYGSMTFNQFGKEFPVGGMNEKGLTIEILQLKATKHIPSNDPRPYLNEAQWAQYQLDRFENVNEVIKNISKIRIFQEFTGVHYFMCDALSHCASVELLNGDFVVHEGATLPYPTLTNSTYEDSANFYTEVESSSKKANTEESLHRHYRAAKNTLSTYTDQDIINKAFDTLKNVKLSSYKPTQWSIVYQPEQRIIHFKTAFDQDERTISLDDFHYDCNDSMQALDIETDDSGDMKSHFVDYTDQINTKWINKNFILVPKWMRDATITYPSHSTKCMDSQVAN